MPSPFHRLPIYLKILSSSVITLLLVCVFIFIYYPKQQRASALESLEVKDYALAEMMALEVAFALDAEGLDRVFETIEWARRDPSMAASGRPRRGGRRRGGRRSGGAHLAGAGE